jgi:hypothetical protein
VAIASKDVFNPSTLIDHILLIVPFITYYAASPFFMLSANIMWIAIAFLITIFVEYGCLIYWLKPHTDKWHMLGFIIKANLASYAIAMLLPVIVWFIVMLFMMP